MALIVGQMEEFSQETGQKIAWKEKACSPGVTAEDMKESILMIKNTEMVCLSGQMVITSYCFRKILFLILQDEYIKGSGKMVSSMELDTSQVQTRQKRKVNGKMAKEKDGKKEIQSIKS